MSFLSGCLLERVCVVYWLQQINGSSPEPERGWCLAQEAYDETKKKAPEAILGPGAFAIRPMASCRPMSWA